MTFVVCFVVIVLLLYFGGDLSLRASALISLCLSVLAAELQSLRKGVAAHGDLLDKRQVDLEYRLNVLASGQQQAPGREEPGEEGVFAPVTVQIRPLWGRILADAGMCTESDWPANLESVGVTVLPGAPGHVQFTWVAPHLVFNANLGIQFSDSPAFDLDIFQTDRPGISLLNRVALYLARSGRDWELGVVTPDSDERNRSESRDESRVALAKVPSSMLQPWRGSDDGAVASAGWIATGRAFEHKYFTISHDYESSTLGSS